MITSMLFAISALLVMWGAIAILNGREHENEAVTLIQTACCHEYKGVLDVKPDPPRSLRFVCKDPATCKRVANYKSAS